MGGTAVLGAGVLGTAVLGAGVGIVTGAPPVFDNILNYLGNCFNYAVISEGESTPPFYSRHRSSFPKLLPLLLPPAGTFTPGRHLLN